MCLMLANLMLLADLGGMVSLVGVILVVALGLGAVIFVHELGHFLVAKACGVKCEKFMIGFDIGGYKLSRKWGETEYGIGILPLGGYVKMLGQDDDPAHIADEMKRCEVAAGSPDAVRSHRPQRRALPRRPPQLPRQERAAADGDHLGRRRDERDLRVHLRGGRLWHGREVHALHRVGNRPRLAGVARGARNRRRNRQDRRPEESHLHAAQGRRHARRHGATASPSWFAARPTARKSSSRSSRNRAKAAAWPRSAS